MLRRLRLALLLSVVVVVENYLAVRGRDTRFSEFALGIAPVGVSRFAQIEWLGLVPGALSLAALGCKRFLDSTPGASTLLRRAWTLLSLMTFGFAVGLNTIWCWSVGLPLLCWQYRIRTVEREARRAGETAPWAGRYYFGDGLGANHELVVSPTRFLYEQSGCMGLYQRTYGRVHEHAGQLELESSTGRRWQLSHFEWRGRRYLLPPEAEASFCRDVHARDEPRKEAQGFAYMHDDDWDLPTRGTTALPERLAPCLENRKVTATVTEMRVEWSGQTNVTIDRGEQDGLWWGETVVMRPPSVSASAQSYAGVVLWGTGATSTLVQITERQAIPDLTGWLAESQPPD